MPRIRHRGLRYQRTKYKPGLGVCWCDPCVAEYGRRCDAKGGISGYGEPFDGCLYVNREKVFADLWEEENERRPGVNYGEGILQDLMVTQVPTTRGPAVPDHHNFGRFLRIAFVITPRERVIVATIVQWLGTNVGWCFLERCVRACGYRLVRDEPRSVADRAA